MKILVISNLFYPDRGGGASVFSDLCFGLVKAGGMYVRREAARGRLRFRQSTIAFS